MSTAPGKGDDHIRTLKQMAIADGLDVPLYTVTGWDGAAIPLDAVLPVFGGYPDAPWDGSPTKLPANEVYAFRFTNRSAGSMSPIGGRGQSPASTYRGTPFLTAEVGDGIEDTYFRRPVVSADDVAAIVPVMLGSGANLIGYYLFHGGRNPDSGAITLQESKATGYPTDVPVRSYDFQAPLGEFGQEHESLRKLKLVHYFLEDFGAILAPMPPRAPEVVPGEPGDTHTPRVSARVLGDSGFLFFNNFVRGLKMPSRPGFQVRLKLPSGTVSVPQKPLQLPSGAFGIWPVNLQLPGAVLQYSTAQLFKRMQVGDQTYFFFFAIDGVRPEFAFDPETVVVSSTGPAEILRQGAHRRILMSSTATTNVRLKAGVHLVVFPQALAEQIWKVDDPSLLLATRANVFANGSAWTMQSDGRNQIPFGIFGTHAQPLNSTVPLESDGQQTLFDWYRATLPPVVLQPVVTQVQPQSRAPLKSAVSFPPRPTPTPLAPEDKDFAHTAMWKIELPPLPAQTSVSDVFLSLNYEGDVARLYHGAVLIDDQFWNGAPWAVGLREVGVGSPEQSSTLDLHILSLPVSFSMYIERAAQLHFNRAGASQSLLGLSLIPQYQLSLQAPAPSSSTTAFFR